MGVVQWGFPEAHYHLYSFDHVQLQVVVTAPDSQLLNLLSLNRLVTVLDETNDRGVICKLQEFYRGLFRGAVICVEREDQWGANAALWSSSTSTECWMRVFPDLLAAACLSRCW